MHRLFSLSSDTPFVKLLLFGPIYVVKEDWESSHLFKTILMFSEQQWAQKGYLDQMDCSHLSSEVHSDYYWRMWPSENVNYFPSIICVQVFGLVCNYVVRDCETITLANSI